MLYNKTLLFIQSKCNSLHLQLHLSNEKDAETGGLATLRASYDEYAGFSDLLCYSPASEKPYSPEADDDAPRAVVYFPPQRLFYIPTLRTCAQLASCRYLPLALRPVLSSPDSFSLWKNEIISLHTKVFPGRKTRNNTKCGLWYVYFPPALEGNWAEHSLWKLSPLVLPRRACDHGECCGELEWLQVWLLQLRGFPFFPPPTFPQSLLPSFLIGKIGEGDMVRAEILK